MTTAGDHGGTMRVLRPFLLRHWRSLAGAMLCTVDDDRGQPGGARGR